jgi:predicted ABC-type transport system involved in lysophospholipase L1 biosynthesis ATPase subunit
MGVDHHGEPAHPGRSAVSRDSQEMPVLHLASPTKLDVGEGHVTLEPCTLHAGEWLLLRPEREALGPDLAMVIARVLATLDTPLSGEIELFGRALAGLSYRELFLLRARLALIPGSGGLLANRTLRENIALPISVHAGLSHREETERVTALLQRFGLEEAADLYPHAVSGSTRLRTCVARATSLTPALLIVEGAGDFVSVSQVGLSWTRLAELRRDHAAALVVIVSRHDHDFEAWFRGQRGVVAPYRVSSESARVEGHVK